MQINHMDLDKNIDTDKKFWRRLYIIVASFLVLQIVLYYFITEYFNK
jgi:hypothetical protein